MAANKVDEIVEVTPSGVTFRRDWGGSQTVALDDLKKPELQAAVKFHLGTGLPNTATLEDMRQALRTGQAPAPATEPEVPDGRNRFTGQCYECKRNLARGEGFLAKVPGEAKRQAYCAAHVPGSKVEATPAPYVGTDTRPATDIDRGKVGPLGDFMEGEIARIAAQVSADPASIAETVRETVAQCVDEIRATLPVRQIMLPESTPTDLPDAHHEALPEVIAFLATGHHVMLTGPAGSGKSTLAHQAAEALSMAFHPMSVGPADMESKLKGFVDAQGNYHATPARLAYEHGGVLLIDEGDNGHPSCLNALNAMLANGVCSFPDGLVTRHADFRCLMATNTFGTGPDAKYVGRQALDMAFLDRFSIKVVIGYDERLETALALGYATEPATRQKVEAWIVECRGYRKAADEAALRVIIGPRTVLAGAALLSVGTDLARVREVTVLAGLDEATRRTIGAVK